MPAKRLLEQAITHGRSSYAGLEFGDEDLRAYIAPLAEVGGVLLHPRSLPPVRLFCNAL